jgi:hypothetical protein
MEKKHNLIKIGFCVSYDWELLKQSVPRVYSYADSICFSIDKNRRSWSGNIYEFNNTAFYKWINKIDINHKISIYEDDFSLAALSPIENDNRQRNLMGQFMGEGGWHIQIDSDEYFLDFKGFREYLIKLNPDPNPQQKPINVCVHQVPLLKKVVGGYLYVTFNSNHGEVAPFATNVPVYEAARRNGHFNHISPFTVIHETWARGEAEVWSKLTNWGHRDDFDKESYYKLWQALDAVNYRYIYNFHPIHPEVWPALEFCEGDDVNSLIDNLISKGLTKTSRINLRLSNSRNVARIKSLWCRIAT